MIYHYYYHYHDDHLAVPLPLSLNQWCVTPSDICENDKGDHDDDDDNVKYKEDHDENDVDDDDMVHGENYCGKPINSSNRHPTGLYKELRKWFLSSPFNILFNNIIYSIITIIIL